MSSQLDVNDAAAIARATTDELLSLPQSKQDAAIKTLSARIIGTGQQGGANTVDVPVPIQPPTGLEKQKFEKALQLLKGVRWAAIEREIGKYVFDPKSDTATLAPGKWFILQGKEPGTYILNHKISDERTDTVHLTHDDLVENGFSLENLHVEAKNFAGPRSGLSTWGIVAAIAVPVFLALAGGITYASMGRGAAAPTQPALPAAPHPAPIISQTHSWYDWTYAPTSELPHGCSQVCDLTQDMWKSHSEKPADLSEWAFSTLSRRSSYTSLSPDDQLSNATDCLNRVGRFDEHTPTLALRRGLNEVTMRGEAFDPIASYIEGGDAVVTKLSQEQTRIYNLLIQRLLDKGEAPQSKTQKPIVPPKTPEAPKGTPKPAEPPKAAENPPSAVKKKEEFSYKSKTLNEAENPANRIPGKQSEDDKSRIKGQSSQLEIGKDPQSKTQKPIVPPKTPEAPKGTPKPAEPPKAAENPPSAVEMMKEFSYKSKALNEAEKLANRIPGKRSEDDKSQIKKKRSQLEIWRSAQLDKIKTSWSARAKAIKEKYQELQKGGKQPSVEEVDPLITELSALADDIEAASPALTTDIVKPHRDRVKDLRQNIVRQSAPLFRSKSLNQLNQTAGRLTSDPEDAAKPNPYLDQQEASEQSIPGKTPQDILFHDSLALQSRLNTSVRQTAELLTQAQPLTIDIVTKRHMQIAAKLTTLESQVQAHYKGILDKKDEALHEADGFQNQAALNEAIAHTRIGLAKSIIQQLSSSKVATSEKRGLKERAEKLLNEAEAAVNANVREQDRSPLLGSIQELRKQMPELTVWDWIRGKMS